MPTVGQAAGASTCTHTPTPPRSHSWIVSTMLIFISHRKPGLRNSAVKHVNTSKCKKKLSSRPQRAFQAVSIPMAWGREGRLQVTRSHQGTSRHKTQHSLGTQETSPEARTVVLGSFQPPQISRQELGVSRATPGNSREPSQCLWVKLLVPTASLPHPI